MLQENVGVEIQPLNSRSIEKYSGEESDVLELSENVIKTVFNDQNVYHFKDFTKKERTDFIESLSLKQIQKIVEKVEEFPRCIIKQKCECKHCGEELDIEVEGLQNLKIKMLALLEISRLTVFKQSNTSLQVMEEC